MYVLPRSARIPPPPWPAGSARAFGLRSCGADESNSTPTPPKRPPTGPRHAWWPSADPSSPSSGENRRRAAHRGGNGHVRIVLRQPEKTSHAARLPAVGVIATPATVAVNRCATYECSRSAAVDLEGGGPWSPYVADGDARGTRSVGSEPVRRGPVALAAHMSPFRHIWRRFRSSCKFFMCSAPFVPVVGDR